MAPRARPALLLVVCFLACSAFSVSPVHAKQRRALQQQSDALSNSNGCLATIPKCESGACATRNIMGVARWVCLRCLANYEPVVDASGQDNIVQCVCPRGTYEPADNATRCSRCEANNYCPGGDKVESPASRGTRVTCGANLVTRNTGARTQTDCVAPAGYAQTSPATATPCERSQYAPMFNRLARCLRCQSGLEEPTNSTLADGERSSKRVVCKVPPGRYVSQGLVRWCPQGFYRADYVAFDALVAQQCLACEPGITTAGAGARSAAECNRVLPGHGISTLTNISSALQIPALPASDSGLPAATVCPIGYYSGGGYCVECPSQVVTTNPGANAVEECVVPPGYFISTDSNSMAQCGPGFFREKWLMYSDPRATACSPCGQGIQSEPRDLDENPLAVNGSLVRATSSSCFIDAGQGMIASGRNAFIGQDCPVNTYGVSGRMYGWAAAPCKPCARNLITDGITRATSGDQCVNDNGFGYASEGGSRCAPGFYSLKGSRKPCQKCPLGRTTADDQLLQRVFTDCYVKPGFGLVSSAGNTTDGTGFVGDTSALSDEAAAVAPVLECPIGYWGGGLSIRATCVPCPFGSTTEETGSTSVEQCSICIPGYGIQDVPNTCTPCNYGSYHYGGGTTCTQCPSATFYAPVDGAGDTWTSEGTTFFKGAFGIEFCVPKESQLSPDAGQIYFGSSVLPELTTAVAQPNLAACIRMCPADHACMIQFDVAAGVCNYAALPWDPQGPDSPPGTKLKYKLPPGTLTSASSLRNTTTANNNQAVSSVGLAVVEEQQQQQMQQQQGQNQDQSTAVRAKMMSSGFYGRCAISPDRLTSWLKAGIPLDPQTAQNFRWGTAPQWDTGKSEIECQRKCDDSVVCWGFLYDTPSQSCLYRGGEDALRSRAFFVMPDMTAVGSGNALPPPAVPSPSPSPAPTANGDLPIEELPIVVPSPSPVVVVPSPSPVVVPSPSPVVVPSPSPEPVVVPSPSPVVVPSPSPVVVPSPSPVVVPSPSPVVVVPSPSPVVVVPSPSPAPVVVPSPSPLPPAPASPSPAPTINNGGLPQPPSPSPSPLAPAPASPSPAPVVVPSPSPLAPTPTPPSPSPTIQNGGLPLPPAPSPSPSPKPSPSPSPAPVNQTGGVLPPEQSAVIFPNGTIPAANSTQCVNACGKSACCLTQFTNSTNRCGVAILEDDTVENGYGFGYRITFKRVDLPINCLVGMNNALGWYQRCKIPTPAVGAYAAIGLNLNTAANAYVTNQVWYQANNELGCRRVCQPSALCWGFIYNADTKQCLFRGGSDQDFIKPGTTFWSTYLF